MPEYTPRASKSSSKKSGEESGIFSACPTGAGAGFSAGFRLVAIAGRAARKCLPELHRGSLGKNPSAADRFDCFDAARFNLSAEVVRGTAGDRGGAFGSHQRAIGENHRVHAPSIVRESELVQSNKAPATGGGNE